MLIYGHVICSILRPLRSWASSSSLSSPASGRGRAAQGSRFTCSPSAYSPRFLWRAQTHGRRRITSMCHDAIPRLRLSALPPFLFFEQNRQAAAIRHRAIPFHRLLPRHFVSGPSVSPAPPGPAGRPGHFTSPTSSFYKSSSSTPSFVILLLYMNMSIGTGTLPFPPYSLHDAASCRLAPTDAPYPPSDSLELDPRAALGQHGPVLPFRSCSSCGSFSFQI